jgi:hypothetical protein
MLSGVSRLCQTRAAPLLLVVDIHSARVALSVYLGIERRRASGAERRLAHATEKGPSSSRTQTGAASRTRHPDIQAPQLTRHVATYFCVFLSFPYQHNILPPLTSSTRLFPHWNFSRNVWEQGACSLHWPFALHKQFHFVHRPTHLQLVWHRRRIINSAAQSFLRSGRCFVRSGDIEYFR